MERKRHDSPNKMYTPKSGTTVYVDYKAKRMELEVEFKNGLAYHYFNVPLPVWEDLRNVVLTGGSVGTFINMVIKPVFECAAINRFVLPLKHADKDLRK